MYPKVAFQEDVGLTVTSSLGSLVIGLSQPWLCMIRDGSPEKKKSNYPFINISSR